MTEVLRAPANRTAARVVEERPDGTVIVEADAPQDALTFLRDLFGGEPVVISATREERGGVAGFFAKEVFRVHGGPPTNGRPGARPSGPHQLSSPARQAPSQVVAPATAPPGQAPSHQSPSHQAPPAAATPPRPAPTPAAPGRPDVENLLAHIGRAREENSALSAAVGSIDEAEETFGTVLRRELAQRGLGGGEAAPRPPAQPARVNQPRAAVPDHQAPITTSAAVIPQGAIDLRDGAPRSVAPEPVVEGGSSFVPSFPAAGVPEEATEVVVAAPEPTTATAGEPVSTAADGPSPAAAPSDRVAASEGTAETDPPAESAAASAAVARMALGRPARSGPIGTGGVNWSVDRLSHLGVPYSLVSSVLDLDPDDDLAWIQRLSEGVAQHVTAEPPGPAVFAGPRADRLAPMLDLPLVPEPELPPYGGSACLKVADHGAGRAWLNRVRGDRVLHVVIGGRNWERLLHKEPDAVAVVGPDMVLTGLQISVEHGLPLSYLSDGSEVQRATALDVVLHLRSLVGRR